MTEPIESPVAEVKPTEDVRLVHEGHKVWAVAYRDGTELGRIRVARQYLDRDLTPERQGAFFEDIAIALKRKINRPAAWTKKAPGERRTVLAGVLK